MVAGENPRSLALGDSPAVKCVLTCGVNHTWRQTSASLNYERFVVTKWSWGSYILPLHTQNRFQVHLDYTRELVWSQQLKYANHGGVYGCALLITWKKISIASKQYNVLTRIFGRIVGNVHLKISRCCGQSILMKVLHIIYIVKIMW